MVLDAPDEVGFARWDLFKRIIIFCMTIFSFSLSVASVPLDSLNHLNKV
jgi:hypothetical protein